MVEAPVFARHGSRSDVHDQVWFSVLVVSILLGVHRIGSISVPLWIFTLPWVLWRFPPRVGWRSIFHPALILIVIAGLSIFLQTLSGMPPVREDVGVYLPLACTLVALAAFSGLDVSDRVVFRALMIGGLSLCAMVVVALVDGCQTLDRTLTFYLLKIMVATPLGSSNYLAAFLVLFFNVAIYRRSAIAAVFAVFVFITMSRSGVALLVLSFGLWAMTQLKAARIPLAAGTVALGLMVVAYSGGVAAFANSANRASMTFFDPFVSFMNVTCDAPPPRVPSPWAATPRPPGVLAPVEAGSQGRGGDLAADVPREQPSSVDDRLAAWQAAVRAIPDALVFGKPRSRFRHVFPPRHWNAHSWPLEVLMLFGLVGLVCYVGYLVVGLRWMWRLSRSSPTWRGTLMGVVLTVLWGVTEVILQTPSYESLLAVIVMVSFARRPPSQL